MVTAADNVVIFGGLSGNAGGIGSCMHKLSICTSTSPAIASTRALNGIDLTDELVLFLVYTLQRTPVLPNTQNRIQ